MFSCMPVPYSIVKRGFFKYNICRLKSHYAVRYKFNGRQKNQKKEKKMSINFSLITMTDENFRSGKFNCFPKVLEGNWTRVSVQDLIYYSPTSDDRRFKQAWDEVLYYGTARADLRFAPKDSFITIQIVGSLEDVRALYNIIEEKYIPVVRVPKTLPEKVAAILPPVSGKWNRVKQLIHALLDYINTEPETN